MINAQQIQTLLKFADQVRIYHWQTKSFSQHMAFGDLYDSAGDLIDSIVEKISGRNNQHISFNSLVLSIEPYKDVSTCMAKLNEFADFLRSGFESAIDTAKDTDILNVRDDLLGKINRVLYLLSLS